MSTFINTLTANIIKMVIKLSSVVHQSQRTAQAQINDLSYHPSRRDLTRKGLWWRWSINRLCMAERAGLPGIRAGFRVSLVRRWTTSPTDNGTAFSPRWLIRLRGYRGLYFECSTWSLIVFWRSEKTALNQLCQSSFDSCHHGSRTVPKPKNHYFTL